MNSIKEVLDKKLFGLHYFNRLILPFQANFIKVIVEDEIIIDFSPNRKGIFIEEKDDFTNVYFYGYKDLKKVVTKYENIKMVIVEKSKNIFDFNNHIKLALYLEEKHKVRIEKCEDEILFLE